MSRRYLEGAAVAATLGFLAACSSSKGGVATSGESGSAASTGAASGANTGAASGSGSGTSGAASGTTGADSGTSGGTAGTTGADSGASGAGGAVVGAGCNTVTQVGSMIMTSFSSGAPPTPAGGSIANGTYVETSDTIYGDDAAVCSYGDLAGS